MTKHVVFVYGTLKRGYGNHQRLGNSEFLGDAITNEAFHVRNVGFPVVLPESLSEDKPTRRVVGELYLVDDAVRASLDALEGVPHMYVGNAKEISPVDGKFTVSAMMYIGGPSYWSSTSGSECRVNSDGHYEWER